MGRKAKHSAFVCDSCGHDEPKWLGRCPACGEWNTFKELRIPSASSSSAVSPGTSPVPGRSPTMLAELDSTPPERFPSGTAELDRVLGGGLAPGSTVLLGGEPGIGKSTLMIQAAVTLPGCGLYISGEESAGQIKSRADRLELPQNSLKILCEVDIDILIGVLNAESPSFVVVDSIQTLVSADAGSIPGTPNQVKIAAHRLTTWAKQSGIPIFLIAHLTKEGTIAGPKVIEHLVDTVLYFDHTPGDLRILRASKNRMGSVDEVGLFRMGPSGLSAVANPEGVFLEHRGAAAPAGSAVAAVYEGSRVLLAEIQALVVTSKGGMGRVYSDRIDAARVSRTAAVLERHAGLRFSDQDIYVNVAGGLRIIDTGAELALALALASARAAKPLPAHWAAVGELTLAGEIRAVPHLRRRIKTAVDSGLTAWTAPAAADESGPFPGRGTPCTALKEAAAQALTAAPPP